MSQENKMELGEPPPPSEEETKILQKITQTLQIPEILEEILKSLEFPHLKVCRQVNKTLWRQLSSKVMMARDLTFTTIQYHSGIFYHCAHRHLYRSPDIRAMLAHEYPDRHLSTLNKILQDSSSSFPCTDVTFNDGRFEDPKLQTFLRLHGHKIKTLTLCSMNLSRRSMKTLLLESLPNLTNLNLDYVGCNLDDDEEQFCLPKLTTFGWTGPVRMVQKILESAPNLVNIANLDNETIPLIIQANKIGAIKRCRVSHYTKMENLVLAADSGVKLKSLLFEIGDDFTASATLVGSAVTRLLNSSRDSLDTFDLGRVGHLCEDIGLPELITLKNLKIGSRPPCRCFPVGINLSNVFPKLQTLDCSALSSDDNEAWGVHFPNETFFGLFSSVKTLKISSCTREWLVKLGRLCPNFKRLILVDHLSGVKRCLANIFQLWSQLQAIHIMFNTIDTTMDFELDNIFTGNEVSRLFTSIVTTHGKNRDEEGKTMGIVSSICDLKELKTVRLTFCRSLEENMFLPLSQVTCLYAFKLMRSDLKATLQFDHTMAHAQAAKKIYEEFAGSTLNIRHVNNFDGRLTDTL